MDSGEANDGTTLPVTEPGTPFPVMEPGTLLPVTQSGAPLLVTQSDPLLPVTQLGDHIGSVEPVVENTLAVVAPPSSLSLGDEAGVAISAPDELKSDSVTVAQVVVSGKSDSIVKIMSSSQKLGAWAKPLPIQPSSDSTSVSTLQNLGSELVQGLSAWPSLSESHHLGTSKRFTRTAKTVIHDASNSHSSKEPPSGIIPTEKTRFPWAAKMDPQVRNLHRTTTPEYMEDGTPKVVIPNHVFLKGLENQKEFVLGQFYRCSAPPGGLIHAVMNRVWGRNCRIFTRKVSESSYLFHIPDASTRAWVLERGLWHVDDCLLFVAPWTPTASLELPEISTIPVWVTLKNIPPNLYSIFGIDWIASGVGEPMLTHKPILDPTLMGEAKIMVEVELDKPFAQKVAAFDEMGNLAMVDVEYSWIPSKCEGCGHLGHKKSRCLLPAVSKESVRTVINPPAEIIAFSPHSTPDNSAPVVVSLETSKPLVETSSPQHPAFIFSASPTVVAPLEVPSQPSSPITDLSLHCDVVPSEQGHALAIKNQDSGSTEPATDDTSTYNEVVTSTSTSSLTTTIAAESNQSVGSQENGESTSDKSPIMEHEVSELLPADPVHSDIETPALATTTPISSFSTPIRQPSSNAIDEIVSNNSFGVLQNENVSVSKTFDLSGYENINVLIARERSRGGRPFKPTQKMQEMEWTQVGGRRTRGRGGRSGRGHHY